MTIEFVILGIPALLLAISMHEFAHGLVAFRLGDPTPKYQGRLTLNPIKHLDPIGAIMLLLFRFGWAKPVMVNPQYFADPQRAMVFVAVAGPLANVTLAWVFYNLLYLVPQWMPSLQLFQATQLFLLINLQFNLGLAAFNLLPFPPLDGSKIVEGLLPPRMAFSYRSLAQYGPLVLILLLVSGMAQRVLQPIYNALLFIVSGFGLG